MTIDELRKGDLVDAKTAGQILGDLVGRSRPYSDGTLGRWRSDGFGPEWVVCGRRTVRYHRAELERWVREEFIRPARVAS